MTCTTELTEERRGVQTRAHTTVEEVLRPAAREWVGREETPWPVVRGISGTRLP